jgi:glyoxylase-like metal-dependent hydrolase (beta-lactamase superfamily II)
MSVWTDLGSGIRVRQSRAYAMNSTLLLAPEHTVLVDPGVLPSEMDDIAGAVHAVSPAHLTLLFTHAHWDHVLGRVWWPAAATLAHARFADALDRGEGEVHREAVRIARAHGETWDGEFEGFRPDLLSFGEREFVLGPWTLLLREAFGHADHQVTVHLTSQHVLLAADMLSDIELPILDGPCEVYRATLTALAPVIASGEVQTLVPGHGAIARGAAMQDRLDDDLAYLEDLDRRVREARAGHHTLEETLAAFPPPGRPGHDPAYAARIHRHNVTQEWEAQARTAA